MLAFLTHAAAHLDKARLRSIPTYVQLLSALRQFLHIERERYTRHTRQNLVKSRSPSTTIHTASTRRLYSKLMLFGILLHSSTCCVLPAQHGRPGATSSNNNIDRRRTGGLIQHHNRTRTHYEKQNDEGYQMKYTNYAYTLVLHVVTPSIKGIRNFRT